MRKFEKTSEAEAERLLTELISVPSVNPAAAPSAEFAEKHCGEKRICNHIARILGSRDFHIKTVLNKAGYPSMLVRLPATAKNKTGRTPCIAFFAHLDTVWTEAMTDPFRARKKNGIIYGLGACDNKASVCNGILTILALSKVKERKFDFVFAATADEESGFTGARTVFPRHLRPDFAVVGEPTGLDVATAHKGVCRWKVETFGKSVHASLVPQGRSAIYDAAELALSMKRHLEDELLKEPEHPLLGKKTLNIGKIEGGTQPNSVPDRCSFLLERRLLPGETEKIARARIESAFRKCGVKYSMSPIFISEPFEISPQNAFVKAFADTVRNNRRSSKIIGLPCGTEAAELGLGKVPTLVFGPGSLGNAHSACENVKIGDIVMAQKILTSHILDEFN